jgi:hypothetical protein
MAAFDFNSNPDSGESVGRGELWMGSTVVSFVLVVKIESGDRTDCRHSEFMPGGLKSCLCQKPTL